MNEIAQRERKTCFIKINTLLIYEFVNVLIYFYLKCAEKLELWEQ